MMNDEFSSYEPEGNIYLDVFVAGLVMLAFSVAFIGFFVV